MSSINKKLIREYIGLTNLSSPIFLNILNINKEDNKNVYSAQIDDNILGLKRIGLNNEFNHYGNLTPSLTISHEVKNYFIQTLDESDYDFEFNFDDKDTFSFNYEDKVHFFQTILPILLRNAFEKYDQTTKIVLHGKLEFADFSHYIVDQDDFITKFKLSDKRLKQLAIEKYNLPPEKCRTFISFYIALYDIYLLKLDKTFVSNPNPITWQEIGVLFFRNINKYNNYSFPENERKLYNSQLVAAAEAFLHIINGSTFIHIAANPQQGKTGVVDILLNLITVTFIKKFGSPNWFNTKHDKIGILTLGPAQLELADQLYQIADPEKPFAYVETEDDTLEKKSRIIFSKKYHINQIPTENFLFLIVDEDHYGQGKNAKLDREFFKHTLPSYLQENNDRTVITLSATGYGSIDSVNRLRDSGQLNAQIVTIPTSTNYKGSWFAHEHCTDYMSLIQKFENDTNIIKNRIDSAISAQRNGLYFFRVSNKIDHFYQFLKEEYGDQIQLHRYNKDDNRKLDELKKRAVTDITSNIHIILIDRLFSLGTDAQELKNHIRLIFDPSKSNVAQIIQSIGRAFGYHQNEDIEFICKIEAIKAHILINESEGRVINDPLFRAILTKNELNLETHFGVKVRFDNILEIDCVSEKFTFSELVNGNEQIDSFVFNIEDNIAKLNCLKILTTQEVNTQPKFLFTRKISRTDVNPENWSRYYKSFFNNPSKINDNRLFFQTIVKGPTIDDDRLRQNLIDNLDEILIAFILDDNDKFDDDYRQNYANHIILVKIATNPNPQFIKHQAQLDESKNKSFDTYL